MKVLIAIDGQPFADAITNYVCNHNWSAGTRFVLVNVMHACRSNDGSDMQVHGGEYATRMKLLQDCGERIQQSAPDTEFACSVLTGEPAEELLAACKKLKPDLLVMGSHGQGFYSRKLLGSVSHELVNHADCSTMIIRLPQHVIDECTEKQLRHEKLIRSMQN